MREDGQVAVEIILDTNNSYTELLLAEDDGLGEIVVSQSSYAPSFDENMVGVLYDVAKRSTDPSRREMIR